MMKIFVFLALPYFLHAASSVHQKSPQKCDYIHDKRTYICKNIVDVFPNIFYGNYHLNCDHCDIAVLRKEFFPYDNNLVSMNLTGSGIKVVEENAFQTLQTLQYILLQDNHIRNISANAFHGLRQVFELHLEHNELSELMFGFLNGFEANYIVLSHNKLSEIPANVFEGIFGAMTLDFSHNKIFTIHVDSFNHLRGLEYLDLQHNKLCNIPLGTFRHLETLRELNLAHNNFKKFNHGMFSGLPNLNGLNLSHNALIEFDASILIPLMKIIRLDISGNGLNYLDPMPLHNNAPGLKLLGISDNLWSCTALVNLVQYLKTVSIEVVEHDKYEVTNIRGIVCIEKPITDEKIPFETFYKVAVQLTKSAYNFC